jgi:DCN1-like protein 1/2
MTSIDSIEGMKQALPGIRKKLNADPVYFKRVYMHTFDLAKKEGARTLALDTGTLTLLRALARRNPADQ